MEPPGWIVFQHGQTQEPLDDWLRKYRPSRAEHSSSAWIAVSARDPEKQTRNEDTLKSFEDGIKVELQAINIGQEVAEKCQAIDGNPDIPVRASKKNPLNKKAARTQEHELAANRLKNLAIDQHITVGKWLFFPKRDNVDAMWDKIARAVVEEDGCLKGKVQSAKVSTYEPSPVEDQEPTHVICVYVEDSWNKDKVGEVFKIMVEQLGLVSGAYKADIYTIACIDSKHRSKMRSSLYNKSDFMSEDEIKAALEARRPKPKEVVKKQAKGTGFVDDDGDDENTEEDEEPQPKRKK